MDHMNPTQMLARHAREHGPAEGHLCLAKVGLGQALVYVYSRDNDAEALQAKVLTKDEARRIAINMARLPQLLGKAD